MKRKVSVVTTTWGQEKFIQETMDGVFMQKYDGPIEFIIANDHSPDKTDQIIKSYLETHSISDNFEIKYTVHKKNLGSTQNFIWAIQQATGEYVAICEGDDYWTDPLKLQKQVDFLEENEDCNLVYHKVTIFDQEQKTFSPEYLNKSLQIIKRDLKELALIGNFMHTPSVLFRNNINYSTINSKLPVGDYLLWFLNGEKGKLAYLPDDMAVYRFSESSTWGKQDKFYRINIWLKLLFFLKKHSKDYYIKESIKKQAWKKANENNLAELNLSQKYQLFRSLLIIEPRFIKKIIKWNQQVH